MKYLLTLTFVIVLFFLSLFIGENKFKSSDKTVIKFSSWGSKSEINVIKQLISNFEKDNPLIKVEFIHVPQNYFRKLHLLFASGLEPDVMFINNQNILMYVNAGLLEELNPYFSNISEGFYKEALECFQQNGKLYAIPRDISNLVIYYNKDIFHKQKVKMPQKINDIFELKKLAKDVTSKSNFGINFEDESLYWLYYLSSNGGGIISDDKKKLIINKQQSIEALNLYSDMINKDKSMPTKADIGSMTTAQMFINGKLAMYLSGRWMIPKFRELINFDWDIIEFPAKNKVYIDSSGYAISKNSKHKKEALLFVKYLSSEKSLNEISKSGLIIPANKNIQLNDNDKPPKNSIAFKTMLNMSKPTPVIENYASLIDIIKEKSESIFNGQSKADEIFNENSVKQLENILEP